MSKEQLINQIEIANKLLLHIQANEPDKWPALLSKMNPESELIARIQEKISYFKESNVNKWIALANLIKLIDSFVKNKQELLENLKSQEETKRSSRKRPAESSAVPNAPSFEIKLPEQSFTFGGIKQAKEPRIPEEAFVQTEKKGRKEEATLSSIPATQDREKIDRERQQKEKDSLNAAAAAKATAALALAKKQKEEEEEKQRQKRDLQVRALEEQMRINLEREIKEREIKERERTALRAAEQALLAKQAEERKNQEREAAIAAITAAAQEKMRLELERNAAMAAAQALASKQEEERKTATDAALLVEQAKQKEKEKALVDRFNRQLVRQHQVQTKLSLFDTQPVKTKLSEQSMVNLKKNVNPALLQVISKITIADILP